MSRNCVVGTRTKAILPLEWLKRVGLSQVSKECRLIFVSKAPRILSQGLGAAAAVVESDMVLTNPRFAFTAKGIHSREHGKTKKPVTYRDEEFWPFRVALVGKTSCVAVQSERIG